ncbi:MAG: hypothetical protein CO099_06850 [Bdellovibrio sp. CG_4_9_14_3_um_filter_39_7]|nr:MAG: hypothetical protein CO099_06850 [Bdellovibrio sp. CG_4_9_14_3_um_filter_39_7]
MILGVESNRRFSGGAALRGGNWNNGTNAGAFALNLNNDSTNTNTNIGFRCVFSVGRLGETVRVKEVYYFIIVNHSS